MEPTTSSFLVERSNQLSYVSWFIRVVGEYGLCKYMNGHIYVSPGSKLQKTNLRTSLEFKK